MRCHFLGWNQLFASARFNGKSFPTAGSQGNWEGKL